MLLAEARNRLKANRKMVSLAGLHQNVDFQIADYQNVNLQIADRKNVDF
jgi:hypothetical protein